MDSDDEISESGSDEDDVSDKESGCGHAYVARASTTSLNFFDSDSSDDEVPPFCFMAKSSRDRSGYRILGFPPGLENSC